jgi:transketolase
LASLRAVPNLLVVRPCDSSETVEAWRVALSQKKRPSVLVFSRQGVANLDRARFAKASELARGAYVLSDAKGGEPQTLLIATGTEVHLALQAQEKLAAQGVPARVVSMPCWELFAEQPKPYRDAVLPPHIGVRVSIEAGATFGWERWTGDHGIALGLDRFGASAPAPTLYEKFGLTPERIVQAVRESSARLAVAAR